MKYLKRYKIFESIESVESIIEECRDILLPIEDDGMQLIVRQMGTSLVRSRENEEIIIVEIADQDDDKKEDFYIYKDSFEHLFSYLKEQGFKFDKSVMNTSWKSSRDLRMINDFFVMLERGSLVAMSIIFSRQKYI